MSEVKLLSWFTFTISGLDQDWSVKVTGLGIMVICSMLLQCAGTLKTWVESGSVTADLTTTVIHSYKSMRHDIKPVYSHTLLLQNCLKMSTKTW